ncbi:MAG: CRISPR system precrRNA processing endoribonuclease RAMP protein Cas6 [Verrucomicrobia bacterium]|nr:CRISPR system precrRNA processing endoribonuclease RAMP protein Cas6 [Verrucomicrobiota bacterium]MCH8512650.1 CRISPR system precrRNA processing endoribonuclease RAMP protein Cas6 [Kiritimatiellia bacterium]
MYALEAADTLPELQDGLKLHLFEAELWLDRVSPIRRLATATLRGLAGHALLEHNPSMFDAYFKPDQNKPPAYLFQPVYVQEMEADTLPFRLVTWDRTGSLGPGILEALQASNGRPFGESGAMVESCIPHATHQLKFSGSRPVRMIDLVFVTPLQLRIHKKILRPESFELNSLLLATIRRLNLISLHYGNGIQIITGQLDSLADDIRISNKRLRWKDPKRHSCTQARNISLGGVVGSLRLHQPTSLCLDLLSACEALHVGRHTAEGCGMIRLSQPGNDSIRSHTDHSGSKPFAQHFD